MIWYRPETQRRCLWNPEEHGNHNNLKDPFSLCMCVCVRSGDITLLGFLGTQISQVFLPIWSSNCAKKCVVGLVFIVHHFQYSKTKTTRNIIRNRSDGVVVCLNIIYNCQYLQITSLMSVTSKDHFVSQLTTLVCCQQNVLLLIGVGEVNTPQPTLPEIMLVLPNTGQTSS